MGWSNWFSKSATSAPDASGAAALNPDAPSLEFGAGPAAQPSAAEAAPVPYDDQVLQAGWVSPEPLDGAVAEHAPATVPGEDALQDALAFLARVYNNQGC